MSDNTRDNIIGLIVFAILAFGAFIGATSAKGENFIAPAKQSVVFTDTTTNHTYQIKEKKYPVYKSKNGKFYIWRTSKNNKKYKQYLPKEVQAKINK